MAELARTFVSRLREFIGNRRGARRCPVRLPFRVTPADRKVTTNGTGQVAWLAGHTEDLSTSGLVPFEIQETSGFRRFLGLLPL